MHYIARLSYNTSNWRFPTGSAQELEEKGSYNQKHGFGHEDWLFRDEWCMDGWRYGFIQGVNKSYKKLENANQPFDITLYTVDNLKRRRYVAIIKDVECLSERKNEPQDALDAFRANGWLDIMMSEINAAGGNGAALGNSKEAKHILNVRFRIENVDWFKSETYAKKGDPVFLLNRYTLTNIKNIKAISYKQKSRAGSYEPPSEQSFMRRPAKGVVCTPQHARIQAKLVAELKKEFPNTTPICEEDYIDVTVRLPSHTLLFEIKCDLDPKSVIRHALGQLLEYAYYPNRKHGSPPKLIIVGRTPLSADDITYLNYLKNNFNLPMDYRMVAM